MMETKLIRLEDGTLVEVVLGAGEAQPIAGKLVEKVNVAFQNITPILLNACRPVITACQDIRQTVDMVQAEIDIGLAFSGEGTIYITKAKATANVTIKLIIKPK